MGFDQEHQYVNQKNKLQCCKAPSLVLMALHFTLTLFVYVNRSEQPTLLRATAIYAQNQ